MYKTSKLLRKSAMHLFLSCLSCSRNCKDVFRATKVIKIIKVLCFSVNENNLLFFYSTETTRLKTLSNLYSQGKKPKGLKVSKTDQMTEASCLRLRVFGNGQMGTFTIQELL